MYTPYPIHFPNVKSFGELFDSIRDYNYPQDKRETGEIFVSFSSSGEHRKAKYGLLKKEFTDFIKSSMQSIVNDPDIFVNVVERDDDTALITFSYNIILGSRWVAIVPADTLPKNV